MKFFVVFKAIVLGIALLHIFIHATMFFSVGTFFFLRLLRLNNH